MALGTGFLLFLGVFGRPVDEELQTKRPVAAIAAGTMSFIAHINVLLISGLQERIIRSRAGGPPFPDNVDDGAALQVVFHRWPRVRNFLNRCRAGYIRSSRHSMARSDIDKSVQRLLTGVLHFQDTIYPREQATYKRLMNDGQSPHTLFITCADSRIDPELITQSGPGEIFVSRNVGNFVPIYSKLSGGVSAVVEYAVAALHVSQVVVCGHTDCGAMIGLLHPDRVAQLPSVKSWLRNGEEALAILRKRDNGAHARSAVEELIEENVVQQLHHLQTHPSVTAALADDRLILSGWVYDIGHGTVRIYSESQGTFLPVNANALIPSGASHQ